METVTGYREDRTGSLSLMEVKILDTECMYQLLEMPAFLIISSLIGESVVFAQCWLCNPSQRPKKKASLQTVTRDMDMNKRLGCFIGGVFRKIPGGGSEARIHNTGAGVNE